MPSSRGTRPGPTSSSGPTIAGGRPIRRYEAYDEDDEAEWIARRVEELVGGRGSLLTRRADDDEGELRPKDVAVMYRMNAQSRAIEEAFLRYGIRYQIVGGTRFYQRREVKDALAYLRVLRSDTRRRQLRADRQRAGPGDRRQDRRGAPRRRRPGTASPPGRRSRPPSPATHGLETLGSRARNALTDFADPHPPPPGTDRGAAAAGAARRGPRGSPATGRCSPTASEEGEERWANLLELR